MKSEKGKNYTEFTTEGNLKCVITNLRDSTVYALLSREIIQLQCIHLLLHNLERYIIIKKGWLYEVYSNKIVIFQWWFNLMKFYCIKANDKFWQMTPVP